MRLFERDAVNVEFVLSGSFMGFVGQIGVVALGGAVGALSRYSLQAGLATVVAGFPLGTMIANIVGSFLAGFFAPFFASWVPWAKPLILTGFLGAFTTMSSFSLEVFTLVEEKRWMAASGHWLGGAVVCILSCALGFYLASRVR